MFHLPILNIRIADNHRYKLIAWLFVSVGIISAATRLALLALSWHDVDPYALPVVILTGTVFDMINAMYIALPLLLWLWFLPAKLYRSGFNYYFIHFVFFLYFLLLTLSAVGEFVFWREYESRYNFIMVDYLLYQDTPTDLVENSWWRTLIVGAALLAAAFGVRFMQPHIRKCVGCQDPLRERNKFGLLYLSFVFIFAVFVDRDFHAFNPNRTVNELAGNGLYDLFAAFRANELEYQGNYPAVNARQSFEIVRSKLRPEGSSFLTADPFSLKRHVKGDQAERRLNVILITVESLNAGFMRSFGNSSDLTPNLDALAEQSLFFTNVYATGMKTSRGLEAITLSIPPTPGRSIIHRPRNHNLFSLGAVLHDKGYMNLFLYGGSAYLDHFNYFFSTNHYKVKDRTTADQDDTRITDEKLYDLSLASIESAMEDGKPVLAHIMTTSAAKPAGQRGNDSTLPEQIQHQVRYADYSLGKFLKACSARPWFSQTVFVITSDHCQPLGKADSIDLSNFHVPLLFYSPGNIAPAREDRLMSQIDITPTLLGLLNMTYTSRFFGYNALKVPPENGRAFFCDQLNLGFLKNGNLVILSPHEDPRVVPMVTGDSGDRDALIREAIAWYESASYAFDNNLYKHESQ